MKIEMSKTPRNFRRGEFKDLYDAPCSIQKSSLAGDDAIWLGIDDPDPKIMARDAAAMGREDLLNSGPERYNGWVKFPLPEQVHITTRMHLSIEQVESLLSILQYFVKYGELPQEVLENESSYVSNAHRPPMQ